MRVTNDDQKPSLEDAIEHYGVKGMRWGVRQGSKTPKGLKRQGKKAAEDVVKRSQKKIAKEATVDEALDSLVIAYYMDQLVNGL